MTDDTPDHKIWYNPWGIVWNQVLFEGQEDPKDVVRTFMSMFYPWRRRSQHVFRSREELRQHMLLPKALARLETFVRHASTEEDGDFTPREGNTYASDPCELWIQVEEMKKDIATLRRWIQLESQEPSEPNPVPEQDTSDDEPIALNQPKMVEGFMVGATGEEEALLRLQGKVKGSPEQLRQMAKEAVAKMSIP